MPGEKHDRRSLFAICMGFIGLMAISYVAVAADNPTWWSPLPFVQFFLFTSFMPRWFSVVLVPALFVGVSYGLSVRSCRWGIYILAVPMVVLASLSVWFFGVNLHSGVIHHGAVHSTLMAVANLAAIVGFWVLWLKWRKAPTASRMLVLTFILFGWLNWFAFPYLWEGI